MKFLLVRERDLASEEIVTTVSSSLKVHALMKCVCVHAYACEHVRVCTHYHECVHTWELRLL